MRMASGDSVSKSESHQTFEVECQKCGLQFSVPIDRFKDEEYKNWLKASLCLQYTKEGLEGFVETTSKEFYTSIESEVLSANNCTCLCNLINFRNSNFNCPNKTCDTLRSALVQTSRKQRIEWENTTLADMMSSPENVMKLFMPRMCRTYTGPQEADSTAILALMDECLLFSSKLRVPDAVNDVRESRNAIMHSGTMRINNNELSQHASNFVALLSDPYHLQTDDKCIEAIRHIKEVCEKKIQINLVEIEAKVMGQHKNLFDGELDDLQQIVESTTLTEDEMESANLRAKKIEEKESKMKVMMEFYNIDTASVASHIATAGALHQQFEKKFQDIKQKAYDSELEKLRQLLKTEQQGKIQLATENVKLTQMYTEKVHIEKLQTDLQTHENETRDIINNIPKMLQEEQLRSSLLQDKLHLNESMVQVLKKHVEAEKSRADELTNTIDKLQTDLQTQNNEMKEVKSTTCSLKNDMDKIRSDAEQRNNSHIIDEMRENINSINKALDEEQAEIDRLKYNESMVKFLEKHAETEKSRAEELTNNNDKLQIDLQTHYKEMQEVKSTVCALKNDMDKTRSDAEQQNESHISVEMRENINSINEALHEEQSQSSLIQSKRQTNESRTKVIEQLTDTAISGLDGLANSIEEVKSGTCVHQNDIGKGRADASCPEEMDDKSAKSLKLQEDVSGEGNYETPTSQTERNNENIQNTETEQDGQSQNKDYNESAVFMFRSDSLKD